MKQSNDGWGHVVLLVGDEGDWKEVSFTPAGDWSTSPLLDRGHVEIYSVTAIWYENVRVLVEIPITPEQEATLLAEAYSEKNREKDDKGRTYVWDAFNCTHFTRMLLRRSGVRVRRGWAGRWLPNVFMRDVQGVPDARVIYKEP